MSVRMSYIEKEELLISIADKNKAFGDQMYENVKRLMADLKEVRHCWKECSDRMDWLEERMEPSNAGEQYVVELYDDYRGKFDMIHEEIAYSDIGKYSAVKTTRAQQIKEVFSQVEIATNKAVQAMKQENPGLWEDYFGEDKE